MSFKKAKNLYKQYLLVDDIDSAVPLLEKSLIELDKTIDKKIDDVELSKSIMRFLDDIDDFRLKIKVAKFICKIVKKLDCCCRNCEYRNNYDDDEDEEWPD